MVVRAGALVLLTVLTVIIGIKYSQIEKKRKLIIHNVNAAPSTDAPVRSSHLMILQLIQSAILFVTYFPVLYVYLNYYILIPAGIDTIGSFSSIFIPIVNGVVSLGSCCNFIFYMALSKKFRRAAKKLVSFCVNNVGPTALTTNNGGQAGSVTRM